ncbi:MAG: beta-propeller domain-containing protein [Ruminococcus sp.]|nr:beta-propeller domain-containing protein [Ruminococcus sp.]
MNNDDKLREQLKSEPVPDRLRPENIKKMLDEQAPKKKRSGISVAGRITAAAAACAVIGGTAAYTMNNGKINRKSADSLIKEGSAVTAPDGTTTAPEQELKKLESYMSGAKDYEQVYTMFKDAADRAEKERKLQEKRNRYKNDVVYEAEAEEDADFAFSDKKFFTADTVTGAVESGLDSPDASAPDFEIAPDVELGTEPATEPNAEPDTEPVTEPDTEPATEPDTEPATEPDEETPEHSDTYHQEQNVLEADIVKTDGRHIYYICSPNDEEYINHPTLRVADVKNGEFTGNYSVDIKNDIAPDAQPYSISITDMYVYNDMIVVIGTNNDSAYLNSNFATRTAQRCGTTFAAFYTTGDEPQLIDVYSQDGYFSDVRISPDGYMLLITNYSTCSFKEVEESNEPVNYIPCCGMGDDCDILPPEDILLPEGGFGTSDWLSYSVVGSIDLNESGAPSVHDTKTLAGYSGSIYCSADNLYTASDRWDTSNVTDITRISVSGGDIVPMASGVINGTVKDQFSMSEYDGYFRVAATYTEFKETFHRFDTDDGFFEGIIDYFTSSDEGYYSYERVNQDSRVYVMDMDLNIVGSVDGLGKDEEIKSASFSGNMAYVVTFRQTDPLYAVDLSDPTAPVVLDEFKINGFSTYMQSWGEGLLFGFGQDANDSGRITGVRMTMFDNSDPNDLKAADVYTWDNIYYDEYYTGTEFSSTAVWDRKALLIAPEKNLIGVPINIMKYSDDWYDRENTTKYEFFSFEDGSFVHKGEISETFSDVDTSGFFDYNRALYIGDYVYVLSGNKFVSADIETLEITDELTFDTPQSYGAY